MNQLLRQLATPSYFKLLGFLCVTFVAEATARWEEENFLQPVTKAELQAPNQFLESGAELIRRNALIEVGEDFLSTAHGYIAIKLHTIDAVEAYSQIAIPYDGYYEDLELVSAATVSPDGTRKYIDKQAVQIQTPPSPYFYKDSKVLVFSLPSLKPGVVLEYEYKRRDLRPLLDGYWGTNLFMSHFQQLQGGRGYRSDPSRLFAYQVRAPKNVGLAQESYNGGRDFLVGKKRDGDLITLHYKVEGLDGVPMENYSPPMDMYRPYVSLSTLKSWKTVGTWASDLFEDQIIASTTLDKMAVEIESRASSDEEKIKEVFAYTNDNVRYIYSHVGRGGYTPHRFDEVIANGYGDCKDQTLVVVSLLRKLGIKAYPALVNTQGVVEHFEDRKQPNFDHMIAYLPDMKTELRWLDASSTSAMFPGPTSYLNKNRLLVLEPGKPRFVSGPDKGVDDNVIDVAVQITTKDNQVYADLNFGFEGFFEEYFRQAWIQSDEDARRLFIDSIVQTVYPTASVGSFESKNERDLFLPFGLGASALLENVWSGESHPLRVGVGAQLVWRQLLFTEGTTPIEQRKSPAFFSNNYSLNLAVNIEQPGENYFPTVSLSGLEYADDNARLTQSHSEKEGSVALTSSVQFFRNYVPLAGYAQWMDSLDALLQAPNWTIDYIEDVQRVERQRLENNLEGISEINELIELLISTGEFSQALELASKSIQREDANGRSYYFLGLAQAYTGDPDAAEESLQTASDLGYEN